MTATLDRWRYLLAPTPYVIEFPKMELISRHAGQPPIVVGRGEVRLPTTASFEYTLIGTLTNTANALRVLNPWGTSHETFATFRLVGTDDRGTEWHCGWTKPTSLQVSYEEWNIRGTFQSLM